MAALWHAELKFFSTLLGGSHEDCGHLRAFLRTDCSQKILGLFQRERENCTWQFMFLHSQGVLNYKNFLPAVPSKSEVDLVSLSLTTSDGHKKREEERGKNLPD